MVFGLFLFVYIADVFYKEHGEYVVFVLGRVYGATKGIAGFPYLAVDGGLV